MRRFLAMLLPVMALGLADVPTATAQGLYANGMSTQGGMFGDRTFGQPLTPQQNSFGGGIQTSPGGSFLYIGTPTSAGGFDTPWRSIPSAQPLLPVLSPADVATMAPLVSGLTPTPAVAGPPEITPAPEAGVAANATALTNTGVANNAGLVNNPAAGINAPPMAPANTAALAAQPMTAVPGGPTAQPPAVTPPARASVALSAGLPFVPPPAATTFTRSPRLSELLTRIARDQNLLAGQGIEVYTSEHVAVLQGRVRNPGDRDLLANVVNLEPGVWQVENRLTVAGSHQPNSMPANGP